MLLLLQVVSVPIVESISPRPPQLPQAIPRDLADTLFAFHGHPFVWFAAQFLKYLMRPNSELADFYQKKKEAMGIKKPYVGYVSVCMYTMCFSNRFTVCDFITLTFHFYRTNRSITF